MRPRRDRTPLRKQIWQAKERLREALETLGTTRDKQATKLGLPTHSTLAPWLNMKSDSLPSAEHLMRIAAQTGYSLDYLLFGRGPKKMSARTDDEADLGDRLTAAAIGALEAEFPPHQRRIFPKLLPSGPEMLKVFYGEFLQYLRKEFETLEAENDPVRALMLLQARADVEMVPGANAMLEQIKGELGARWTAEYGARYSIRIQEIQPGAARTGKR